MKKGTLRSLSLLLALILCFGILAGCVSNDPAPSANVTPDTTTPAVEPSDTVDPLDTTEPVTLNLSVFYNSSVYMRYTVDGGNNKPQSEYVAANGTTYREGDFKPVWQELQSRLNFTVNDVTPSDAKDIRASFQTLQAQNFSGVDMLVGNSLEIVSEGVTNGTFVALNEYLDIMPNFSSFLDENSVVKNSITAGNGNIYYAPYFDGYDDIERMNMMRVDWVQKLLDDDSVTYDTDRTIETYYQPYMPETLNTTVNAVTADGKAVQQITKSYTQNVITVQNSLTVKNGANLVQALKEHIDATYPGVYANRSDLFVGQDAAYDADELIALMRCVLANTTLLTGQSEYDAVPLFPRKYQPGRYRDLFRFAEIWGVNGLDSRLAWLYVDNNGELQDARMQMETMDALERLNAMYKEGLILQDFDKDEATAGLSGSEHRDRLLNSNLGFMTHDYNQTTTVYNSLDASIDGFNFTPVLPAMADWDDNGTYYQFTDSWRSVKEQGWGILSSIASDEAKLMRALKLVDYMYSAEGNRLMSYGPEAWIDGEIEYNGEMVPKLSDAALTELAELAGGNYTNYYRMWLGATFPIGYVKQQGMEYQTVHAKGKVGLEYILNATNLGTMKHLVVDANDADIPSRVIMPTTLATTTEEENLITANCAEFVTNFRDGNNDNDRIIFADYILYGFEGKTANGDSLLSKQGLIDYLTNDLRGGTWLEVYRSAYDRTVNR